MSSKKSIVEEQGIRVAIDTGGTFTDFQIYDSSSGNSYELKTPTTPEDPSLGLVTGLEDAAKRFGFTLSQIDRITHGTTIATNALLQSKFPRGALITTEGFTDVLEIGRHVRKDVYSLEPEHKHILMCRRDRFGLSERMGASGTPIKPVCHKSLESIVEKITNNGIETIAVCLINAHVNAQHEIEVGNQLEKFFPTLPISLSTDITPEIREYERTSSVVLNALLRPIVETYISNLEARLKAIGINAKVFIIQSNGGVCSPATASKEPVRLFLSGPSGGAAAACHLSLLQNKPNLIAMDIGGTSTDVSIVFNGKTSDVYQSEIEGCALKIPMIEIRTIGAGGGSIASISKPANLRVGPESAGANPGPAAYGLGGELATVTDAHVALGTINPNSFFEGKLDLSGELSRKVIDVNIAAPLQSSIENAAEGLVEVVSARMSNAIRLSLFEKGLDPLDFSLVGFGGGGGLHAIQVAEEIGIKHVLFPRYASTFSAYGLLWSNIIHDFVVSVYGPIKETGKQIIKAIEKLNKDALQQLAEDSIALKNSELKTALDLRYQGQAFELSININSDQDASYIIDQAIKDFHDLHKLRYAYSQPEAVIELVAVRLRAIGTIGYSARPAPPCMSEESIHKRDIYHEGAVKTVNVYKFDNLLANEIIEGPVIIEQPYTTILIPAHWNTQLTEFGDLEATKRENSE